LSAPVGFSSVLRPALWAGLAIVAALLPAACVDLPQPVLFPADDVEAARQYLEEARARIQDPAWGPSGTRAVLLAEVGLWDEAAQLTETLEDPGERDLARAVLALRKRDYPAAKDAVARLLELDDEDASALALRGSIELARADLSAARLTGERILQIEGQDTDAAVLLGRIHLRRSAHQEAIDWARRAQRWDPSNPDAHTLEARVRLHRGELDGAAETLERTLRIDPLNPEARFLYGLVRLRQGGPAAVSQAWGHWRLALEVDPLHGRAVPTHIPVPTGPPLRP